MRYLGWSALGLGAAGLLTGLLVAPVDAVQGQAQRLMYLHVPAAWTAYAAFLTVLVASLRVLTGAPAVWDAIARAAAEIGVGLTALTLALGSIWGRATWGVWWAWDPRTVSTVLMALVYLGQLALRWTGTDPARARRHAAYAGIAGFLVVPLVHCSVLWWRSLHQPPTLLAPSTSPPIDVFMLIALLLCVAAATTAGAWLLRRRVAALLAGQRRAAPARVMAGAVR